MNEIHQHLGEVFFRVAILPIPWNPPTNTKVASDVKLTYPSTSIAVAQKKQDLILKIS